MNRFEKLCSTSLVSMTLALQVAAQTTDDVEMADVFHTSGKIYVVVAILVVIFIGFVILLINIDRKVSRLEKELKERKS